MRITTSYKIKAIFCIFSLLTMMFGVSGCAKKGHLTRTKNASALKIEQDNRPKESDALKAINDRICDNPSWEDHYKCEFGELKESLLLDDKGKKIAVDPNYRIAYQIWTPKNIAIPEGVILLVTGRGEYLEKYHPLIARFQKDAPNYTVAVYDHYGQGHSWGTGGHVDSLRVYAFDMGNVVKMLHAKLDPSENAPLPFYVIAHSMGALVATAYAAGEYDVFAKKAAAMKMQPVDFYNHLAMAQPVKLNSAIHHYAFISPMYKIATRGVKVPEGFLNFLPSTMVNNNYGLKRFALPKSPYADTHPLAQIGDPTYSWLNMAVNESFMCLDYDKAKNTPGFEAHISKATDVVGLLRTASQISGGNFHHFEVLQPKDDFIVEASASKAFCQKDGIKSICHYTELSGFGHDVFGYDYRDAKLAEKQDLYFKQILQSFGIVN